MNSNDILATLRRLWKSGMWGIMSLCAVNLSAVFTGVSLGFGWLSGGTAALFGPPGVVGLLLLNAMFAAG